jgi:hypothetical protein
MVAPIREHICLSGWSWKFTIVDVLELNKETQYIPPLYSFFGKEN